MLRTTRARLMKTLLPIVLLAALAFPIINGYRLRRLQATDYLHPAATESNQFEQQIDRLVGVDDRASFGFEFLPAPAPGEGTAGIIEDPPPGSVAGLLRPLVAAGLKSLPHLIAHLSDQRKTRIVVEHSGGFGGMFWSGEYDRGRVEGMPQSTTVREQPADNARPPSRHVVTVGDLCWVAVGQIVNREFLPVRYVPTAITVINSPTTFPELAAATAKEWADLTPERHRQSLLFDFDNGSGEEAILRLAYYYPEAVESIALDRLARPMYSWDVTHAFMEKEIYSTTQPAQWDKSTAAFVAKHGPAFRDGIEEELIWACWSQDNGNKERYDPSAIFRHLFPDVNRKKWPHPINAIEQMSQTDFIRHIAPLKSAKVDDEVYRIFHTIGSGHFDPERENDLALASMVRLIDKGHNEEFIAYCDSHSAGDRRHGDELVKLAARLRKSQRS
ncbi:MAG TPA: hypothetical protein VH370_06630 [Humisphaera sp.]|nr:hypothetical protein [Humisphaera sp.]